MLMDIRLTASPGHLTLSISHEEPNDWEVIFVENIVIIYAQPSQWMWRMNTFKQLELFCVKRFLRTLEMTQVLTCTNILKFSQTLSKTTKITAQASGTVVGTTLQAERRRVRFPIKSLIFFHWPNTSSRTMALGSTQPPNSNEYQEPSLDKERPDRKADNLTIICEPIV
jgi:hypothetical protein